MRRHSIPFREPSRGTEHLSRVGPEQAYQKSSQSAAWESHMRQDHLSCLSTGRHVRYRWQDHIHTPLKQCRWPWILAQRLEIKHNCGLH